MATTWRIRALLIDDHADVTALWRGSPGVGLDGSDSREAIAAFLDRNPGSSFVALAGEQAAEQIVGAVLCGHDGRRAAIYHLAVADTHRRQGIATALVDACLGALRAAGIPRCHVMVFRTNTDGSGFWARFGARERTDLILSTIVVGG